MDVLEPQPRYCAWLLRCHGVSGPAGAELVWRFSVEDPHTGERRAFASLAALVAFLCAELGLGGAPPRASPAPARGQADDVTGS